MSASDSSGARSSDDRSPSTEGRVQDHPLFAAIGWAGASFVAGITIAWGIFQYVNREAVVELRSRNAALVEQLQASEKRAADASSLAESRLNDLVRTRSEMSALGQKFDELQKSRALPKDSASTSEGLAELRARNASLEDRLRASEKRAAEASNLAESRLTDLEQIRSEMSSLRQMADVLSSTNHPDGSNAAGSKSSNSDGLADAEAPKAGRTSLVLHRDEMARMPDGTTISMYSFKNQYGRRFAAQFYVNGRENPYAYVGQRVYPGRSSKAPCFFEINGLDFDPKSPSSQIAKVDYVCAPLD
ncbi:MAG: hypothetical protein H6959_05640 [Chromatiaceae bacterium]|nr:hypothetical protein [Chromatiaceae bacterium]MCP5422380.1 hypothetical protein [Chromatiaceae bacterium]